MIKLKNLLFEAVLDVAAAEELAARVKKEIQAPYVSARVSTLGGQHRPAVMMTVSLDDKSEWTNGILHNSRFMMFDIGHDGVIDQHSIGHKVSKKFRKSRFKTPDEVIKKINIYIKQVQ